MKKKRKEEMRGFADFRERSRKHGTREKYSRSHTTGLTLKGDLLMHKTAEKLVFILVLFYSCLSQRTAENNLAKLFAVKLTSSLFCKVSQNTYLH